MDKFRQQLNSWLEGVKNTYRLVVMNDETFEEVGSYRLTRLNVYIMASSIFVILVIFVFIIIAFTPLKQYIPGYGDVNLENTANKLEKQVSEIEKELIARELYISKIQKVLTGGVDTTDYEAEGESLEFDTAELNFTPIPDEYALRNEIEREEMQSIGDVSASIIDYEANSLDQLYFLSPLKGSVVRTEFQPEEGHFGIDLLASTGSFIASTLGGVVILSDYTFETGYVIGIQHSNNLVSFYKHNSKLLKKAGEKVKAGEAIAIIGNTGEFSDGPHLHFEIWHNSKPVNPREFIVF